MRTSSSSSLGSVLVLSNLFPHPSTSAAGVRTSYLLRQLCRDSDWESVHYATGEAASTFHEEMASNDTVQELIREGVCFHSMPPNQSMKMKELLQRIPPLSLVILDRFYTEEAYSFHIHNHCPDAVRVVDMQDMHSLRQGRMRIVQESDSTSWDCISDSLSHVPSHRDDMLLRELASLHRSDLTLVCSPHEFDLLSNTYKIPLSKLCMAPFWVSEDTSSMMTTNLAFKDRRDFVFIGGFLHKPNIDAVQQLANSVWPRIRERLPGAQLHVYGAYCPPSIQKLHDSTSGFLVRGFAPSLRDALVDKRAMLVPLRYGAGIKGKILDAWTHGLPVVTTSIGSEGMLRAASSSWKEWGGAVTDNIDDFVDESIDLYVKRDCWDRATWNANAILLDRFPESQFDIVSSALKDAVRNRRDRRHSDYIGSLLWHQTVRSTEYFSRWIETKERKSP